MLGEEEKAAEKERAIAQGAAPAYVERSGVILASSLFWIPGKKVP